jgi:hypothetical protein
MQDIGYRKQFLYYRPNGRRRRRSSSKRDPEKPLKRPLDGYNVEAETGYSLA